MIDCPPNYSVPTRIAMAASSHYVVPARADYLSTIGLKFLASSYENLVEYHNMFIVSLGSGTVHATINPRPVGIIFTMVQYNKEKLFTQQQNAITSIKQEFEVFSSMMRYN